uniref:Uncharacterized protein n=1 Tax=Solanum lycopersicum TaxID=4081 RepID=A0A3Q7HDA6_SOLLC
HKLDSIRVFPSSSSLGSVFFNSLAAAAAISSSNGFREEIEQPHEGHQGSEACPQYLRR